MKKGIFYRIGFNTLVQFAGKIISVALGLLTVILLTRYLGTTGYGDFTLVFAYLSFFTVFADFGLQLTIVRELSQKSISPDKLYGTYFWLKIILVVVSTSLALLALLFFPYSSTLKFGILIGSLAVGVGGLSGYGSTIFQSNVRLDLVTYIDIITKLVTVALIAFFVYLKFSFYHIVATVLFGNAVGLIVTIVLLKNFIHFRLNFDSSLAKKVVRWTVPIGLTSFFSLAYFRLDTIMLSVLRGSAEVGIYSLSYKILENVLVLWGLYMASVYPLMSSARMSTDNSFSKLFKGSIAVSVVSSSLIILVGYFLSPLMIDIFGGREFSASILPFRILIFSVPLFFLENLFYNLLLIEKKIFTILFGMGITLALNFFLNFIFIPKAGYIAASYITILSEFSLLAFYLIVSWKRIKISLAAKLNEKKL